MGEEALDIAAVAAIARISLGEEERERLGRQLAEILRYAEQLMAVDVEGVEPATHPFAEGAVPAEDAVESGFSTDEALRNAPRREGNLFSVPRVLEDV
ncbi:MAG: Asp-tRNA(Asn)/Glu-tRNA(Gln) amidotransferase subunit GatC [Puniceicoccales bacterium]|jgi:aspartyl-tRNA(Asn)/glutamyl-tRNA(Gln) amidotransferase subunit C|nr:Asp-tRNA(Asn)/Glu-tRNA(Gln) amidotransferase subunit GatC [Puniceicoccales bacterium]